MEWKEGGGSVIFYIYNKPKKEKKKADGESVVPCLVLCAACQLFYPALIVYPIPRWWAGGARSSTSAHPFLLPTFFFPTDFGMEGGKRRHRHTHKKGTLLLLLLLTTWFF